MKPLLHLSVSLWALLVFSALLKICDSHDTECNSSEVQTTTTTTTVTLTSIPNCSLSIGETTSNNSVINQLIPGKVYRIFFSCSNCSKNVTLKPEAVTDLIVTGITTSSMSLTWTKQNFTLYNVTWTDGEKSESNITTETVNKTITGLTAGLMYNVTVTPLAEDRLTEGGEATVSKYTKPEAVKNLTVTDTTTSALSLNWTPPYGSSSFYIVQWSNGTFIANVTQTDITINGLTAGVQYTISVFAVAADGRSDGQISNVSHYTRPGEICFHSVSTNTSSISLNWTRPSGEVFKYRVEWNNGGVLMHRYTNDTATVLSDLIPGTNYSITIFAVSGDDKTGDPYTFSSVTNPDVVNSLSITSIATTSVSLAWTKPVGNATSYSVQWAPEEGEGSTNATSFTIKNLIPGFQYNITVTAVAETSTGKGSSITTFTSPDQPEDIISIAPGTRNLNISWTLPTGRVDHYVVNISNAELSYFKNHTTTVNMTSFTHLNPGRVFDITVTAVAGSFCNTSVQTSHATRPIPPDSIIISQRTNSSLHLNWPIPELMAGAPNVTYYITYQVEGGEVQNSTIVNNILLSSLSSGTYYNISLVTGGPQNLTSTAVYISSYTQPNPVLNLVASPNSTTSVEVKWSYPHEIKSYYKYRIRFNTTATINSTEIDSTNETVIGNLEPGTRYCIKVTTIASKGIESTDEETSSYTMPKAVTNIIAEFVNTTAIKLTWLRQSDHKPSYSYEVIALLGAMMVKNGSTENETYTFSRLTPGTLYTFKVFTVVGEVKSTAESTENHTKPEAVSNITVIGSTTNLSVHWRPASGEVAFYTVLVYRDSQLVKNSTDLSNNTEKELFLGLMPGVRYCVMVVTKSGPWETNSSAVCNATFPNPPGAIMVDSQTVESINFTWPLPEDMDHKQYNFTVSTVNGSFLTENNWFLLDNLQSGTPYNISVVTVGLQNYESTAVTTENYTRPYPVTKLRETKITTDAVTLEWEQPESKPHYSYFVQTSNSSISKNVLNTTSTIPGLNSGTNYSFTVITYTADGTQSAPVTVSYFTRPYGIGQLVAETLNTTAVHLVWAKPLQYKAEYTYRVETTGFDFQNITIKEEVAVSELTPGANYTFCVWVIAANGIEGEPICTSQYTEPETVQPSVSSQGSNSSILVSWTKPPGRVEYYMVHLNGTFTVSEVSSNNTSWLFKDLSAGRLYTAIVTTFSGPFNASSEFVTNATFPNAPGPIEIRMKTVSSIEIRWEEAPLMTNTSFKYLLRNISSQGDKYIPSTTATHNFTSLLSGTSYNISVATVGAMDFQSEKVEIYKVTTRPFNANNLSTLTGEEMITVNWAKPDQYKESYRFYVTSAGSSFITEKLMHTIRNLAPGTRYNFSVTTETSDGTKGASRWISSCTNASPVRDFQCEGPNKTNAELMLSWNPPKGQHSGFNITVNDKIIHMPNTCCNHTVSNLRHYTSYTLKVVTLSCGQPSTLITHTCWTGITDPPVPQNYISLSEVRDKKYNSFYVHINSSLLDETNGPITDVGVLVTNYPDDSSQLSKYLVNNYEDWKENKARVYLATVKTNPFKSRSQNSDLPIHIGDGSKWYSYTNGHLDAKGKYQYAIVMFTNLVWKNNVVDVERSLVSITGFYYAVELPNNPAVIGIAVGATMGIFCVLFIILIGFIIYWKRLSKKENTDIQIHSMRAKVSVAVRVEDYEAYYKKQKADSNCGFAEEFEDLKLVGTAQAKTNALNVDNKPKNRYNNVLPYDSSRVKLSIIHGSPYDDYINANYMPGYNSRKEFIAAQGPLPVTVKDFWRMVWEKNVQTLVMLTRCNEQGRVKCEKYWDYGTKHFENITVTTTSEIPLEDWTIRDFDIKNVKTAETRSVRQFHFTAWPDHGVPETTELLISFRHLVREHMDQYSRHSPAVVHCSAGVGRTGTFIAIDRLIFQIERENIVDVYGIVHDLRMHRPLMVQTEDQFIFLNQCAMDIIRSRTGTNVDLIYQNAAALSIYENVERKDRSPKNGYHDA